VKTCGRPRPDAFPASPTASPSPRARSASGCGNISYDQGSLFSNCQMSDDHQSFDVGSPSKSSVTLGLTAWRFSSAPTTMSAGCSVTTKPFATLCAPTSGFPGRARGAIADGPHAALASTSKATANLGSRMRGSMGRSYGTEPPDHATPGAPNEAGTTKMPLRERA